MAYASGYPTNLIFGEAADRRQYIYKAVGTVSVWGQLHTHLRKHKKDPAPETGTGPDLDKHTCEGALQLVGRGKIFYVVHRWGFARVERAAVCAPLTLLAFLLLPLNPFVVYVNDRYRLGEGELVEDVVKRPAVQLGQDLDEFVPNEGGMLRAF